MDTPRVTRSKSKQQTLGPAASRVSRQETSGSGVSPKDPPKTKTAGRQRRPAGPGAVETPQEGEASEAESNCSSASGFQGTTTVRVTRRRLIVITQQPEARPRSRRKTISQSESVKSREDEVSEAESCASRGRGRTRPSRAKWLPDPACEARAEEVSDAESWCSGISSWRTERLLRSSRRKLQKETGKEGEHAGGERAGNADLVEPAAACGFPDLLKLEDSEVEAASTLPEKPASPSRKPERPQNETRRNSNDEILSEAIAQFLTRARGENSTSASPCKEAAVETSPRVLEQADEDSGLKEKEKEFQLKLSQSKQSSPRKSFTPPKQSTPDKNQTVSEPQRADDGVMKNSSTNEFDFVEVDTQPKKTDSPKITTCSPPITCGGGKMSVINQTPSNQNQEMESLESDTNLRSPGFSPTQDKRDSLRLVLDSDDNRECEDSEAEGDTLCFVESHKQPPSLDKDSEGSTSRTDALFVIDTTPGLHADQKYYLDEESESEVEIEEEAKEEEEEEAKEEEEEEVVEEEEEEEEEEPSDHEEAEDDFVDEDESVFKDTKMSLLKLSSSSIDPGLSIKQLGGLYINLDADKAVTSKNTLTQIKEKKKKELLQKCIVSPDFEKKDCIPPYKESKNQLKKKRRQEREKTTGDGWFGMKAPELTTELKNDLQALKLRGSMDPKRFYKKNDRDGFPKYFQVGTVVDNPVDFYHARIPKKQRKRTIVEELLADSEFRSYNKKKYQEIMIERAADAAGKKNKKKRKFRN
ncbi:deoxynucleotidyltransferase terminal-interacting protein 2 [Tachyglossus aculeatus]|uniref:deoxynucleotidyltransferase terminal-interacting protein 2 n=1 Tax=Tachyglossus aculeatus TaxID=9261 RepID=UPI0018F303D2|nr:deoxynucleotidyltransferase terminal-interacting protein 2 [Tachyglossus aculeatus]